ncbi:MAG: hypothetical protein M3Z02_01805 [Actinomycetota bacterium]|nr:hypothetical protein [Actinomycetota bacterium]
MSADAIEGWLSEFSCRLAVRGRRRRRITAEVKEHLMDAADADSAEDAVARFGSPAAVAGQFRSPRPRLALALLLWLPAATAATVCAALVYAAGQHTLRASANDPQTQVADDAAAQLDAGVPLGRVVAGPPVDLARSLAGSVTVVDDGGAILASTGQLEGRQVRPPLGTLRAAGTAGRQVVTWQPRPSVRQAAVIVAYRGPEGSGTVVAARSLRLVEQRESELGQLVGVGWLLALAAAAAAALLCARWWVPGDPGAGSWQPAFA